MVHGTMADILDILDVAVQEEALLSSLLPTQLMTGLLTLLLTNAFWLRVLVAEQVMEVILESQAMILATKSEP